jgi:3-deoxy-D-manno-octulosonic-acid transferase
MRTDPIERLLRGLYSAALYVLVPVTVYHLIWRGFRQREYFQRWNERYAAYGDAPHAATVWVHAVSVGEVNAAAPLVDVLRATRPDLRLLVTTITPTGSSRVRARWGSDVEHVYLP